MLADRPFRSRRSAADIARSQANPRYVGIQPDGCLVVQYTLYRPIISAAIPLKKSPKIP